MAKEVEITATALSDMRDVLEEIGYVTAQTAKPEAVIKRIKSEFGLERWLRHYGYEHLIP
jgi:hypothetical protein